MTKNLFAACLFVLSFYTSTALSVSAPQVPAVPGSTDRQTLPSPAPRIALIVGNTDYAAGSLRTAAADADVIAAAVSRLGFTVIRAVNTSGEALQQALDEWNTRLGPQGTGLFYFAGHGLQTEGTLYLLPTDADTRSQASLEQHAVSIESIVDRLSQSRSNGRTLIVLDTCLNDPYDAPDGYSGRHITHMPILPDRTLIAFATGQGTLAYEGGGTTGIYAQALADALRHPGLDIDAIFKQVQNRVSRSTGGRQVPWVLSTLDASLVLNSNGSPAGSESTGRTVQSYTASQLAATTTRGILPQDGDAHYELEFWQSIKDSTNASDYEAYLEAYPDGRFAPLAKARIERYKKSAPEPAVKIDALDEDFEVINTANIRQGPSSGTPRIGELQRGSRVRVTGKVSDKDWYQIKSDGQTGYVFADLLRKPAARPKPKPVEKPVPQPVATPPARPAPAVQRHTAEEIVDCPSCPVLVTLPPGQFMMGSSNGDRSEKPRHRVSITKPFAIGKYEVTVAQWNACVKAGGCSYKPDLDNTQDNTPVRDISWNDASEYVAWLGKITGKAYRLPTEAEWEYAARGGTDSRFWWGDRLGSGQADCRNCGGKWDHDSPAAVDAFPANPFGLYGTSGGVWEWVADCWHKTYQGAPGDGTAWTSSDCRENVIRGGAWRNKDGYIHSASRFKYDTYVRYLLNGFRVARSLP